MNKYEKTLFMAIMADDILSHRKTKTKLCNKIDEQILNAKDRYICKRKLIDGITFERLAEEVDLSIQQTKTRFYRAKAKLNIG